VLAAAFGERASPQRVQALVAAGKLGKKSGEGFYTWTHATKELLVAPNFR